MDEAAISHNLGPDDIYDHLLDRLFLQSLWSTPVLCSDHIQTPPPAHPFFVLSRGRCLPQKVGRFEGIYPTFLGTRFVTFGLLVAQRVPNVTALLCRLPTDVFQCCLDRSQLLGSLASGRIIPPGKEVGYLVGPDI
jgi:hypothetical protein